MQPWRNLPNSPPDSNKTASGKPGAVQTVSPISKEGDTVNVVCGTLIQAEDNEGIVKVGTAATSWCPIDQSKKIILGGFCQYKHATGKFGPEALGPTRPVWRKVGEKIQEGWECVVPNTLREENNPSLKLVSNAICGVMCTVSLTKPTEPMK